MPGTFFPQQWSSQGVIVFVLFSASMSTSQRISLGYSNASSLDLLDCIILFYFFTSTDQYRAFFLVYLFIACLLD